MTIGNAITISWGVAAALAPFPLGLTFFSFFFFFMILLILLLVGFLFSPLLCVANTSFLLLVCTVVLEQFLQQNTK